MKYARPAPISGWSPIRFLLAVLAITFAVELGVMFLLPVLLPLATPEWTRAVVDAGLLTLISAPILWWLFIHPLRGIALAEQARSAAVIGAAVEGIITMDGEGMSNDKDKDRHDFKNQLGIILGFSEILLAEAAGSDPRRGDLEEIHKAATTALDLLDRAFPIDADTPQ